MNRYQNNRILTTIKGKQYYATTLYQNIPLSNTDLYVNTTVGDRYDLLANQYYDDPSLWWIISIANDLLPQNSIFIPEGTQLRIPVDVNSILTSYNELNS